MLKKKEKKTNLSMPQIKPHCPVCSVEENNLKIICDFFAFPHLVLNAMEAFSISRAYFQ